MKKILLTTAMVLGAWAAVAQAPKGVPERFSCNFRMLDESGGEISAGKGYVQGECYRLETAGMQVWCNGVDRWIYSPVSDELVIQANDVSFLKDVSVSLGKGATARVSYQNYMIVIDSLEARGEPWSDTFFIIDPEVFGIDTVITDLRR